MVNRVIIADINSWNVNGRSNGHYIPVAKNYQDVFASKGVRATIAGGPVFAKSFKDEDLIRLPYDVGPRDNGFVRKVRNLLNARVLFRQTREEDVIIFQASATAAVYAAIALFAKKGQCIYLIQYSPTEGLSSIFKRFLWRCAKSKVLGIIGTSDAIGAAFDKPCCVVPDYIATKSAERKTGELLCDFVFAGTINEKKGVVEGAAKLLEKGASVKVAGRSLDATITGALEALAKRYGNLSLQLGYLEESAFEAAICSAKMTVLNYTDAYSSQSSGIVYDSLFRLSPILGRRCHALEFVEEFGLGYLYDDLSEVVLSEVMSDAKLKVYRENILGYLEQHKSYAEKLCKFVM